MPMQDPDLAGLVAEDNKILARVRTALGRSVSCSVRQIGSQKRRKYSPIGVPGPVSWSSASCSVISREW